MKAVAFIRLIGGGIRKAEGRVEGLGFEPSQGRDFIKICIVRVNGFYLSGLHKDRVISIDKINIFKLIKPRRGHQDIFFVAFNMGGV